MKHANVFKQMNKIDSVKDIDTSIKMLSEASK